MKALVKKRDHDAVLAHQSLGFAVEGLALPRVDRHARFVGELRRREREDRIVVSDRKVVKLYRLVRARAFLFHGGAVRKEDLVLLRYIGDRSEDFAALKEKVDALLRLS